MNIIGMILWIIFWFSIAIFLLVLFIKETIIYQKNKEHKRNKIIVDSCKCGYPIPPKLRILHEGLYFYEVEEDCDFECPECKTITKY